MAGGRYLKLSNAKALLCFKVIAPMQLTISLRLGARAHAQEVAQLCAVSLLTRVNAEQNAQENLQSK